MRSATSTDVCARLTLDVDDDRRDVVHPGRLFNILDIIDDVLRDVGQMYRGPHRILTRSVAVVRTDHERSVALMIEPAGGRRMRLSPLVHVGGQGDAQASRVNPCRLPTSSVGLDEPPVAVRR